LALLLLGGCHADVTFRFDLHANGTALATTSAVLDDQLYRLATSRNAGEDPLGIERLQRDGWTISRARNGNGDHIITISKLLSRKELGTAPGGVAPALRGASLPFTSIELSRSPGLFAERDSLAATTPALLPWAEARLARRYAAVASAMAGSVVALHLELRTPGKVVATNGAMTPNRFARWDLGLFEPTTILYTVRVVHYERIAAVVVALVVLLLAVESLRGRFKPRQREGYGRRNS
jgi:hypothetical protein